ncbi:Gfo/Idh/MocA family oxidoreductase [Treponema sp.]
MKNIAKLALVGTGNMGSQHLKELSTIEGVRLVALCDLDEEKVSAAASHYSVPAYTDVKALFNTEDLDGVIIATPHFFHPPIAMEAFGRGISVLTEKPIAVTVQDARVMNAAYEKAKAKYPDLVYTAMFQQRTQGNWMKAKAMIDSGELGRIVRTSWIITDWFRTQAYFDSGGWRATWSGEGGGVLMNQCPHNLDLFQWFVGMPSRVSAFVSLGKYHNIEVEDEVTAFFEYDNGMVGHFITSTAEAPGTNRLEFVGEKGKLICEKGRLYFSKNAKSMLAHLKEAASPWEPLAYEEFEIPVEGPMTGNHRIVLEDFATSIREARAPRIDAREGINMVSLDNAIMYAALEKKTVSLPLVEGAFEEKLAKLQKSSKFVKTVHEVASNSDDFERSYKR